MQRHKIFYICSFKKLKKVNKNNKKTQKKTVILFALCPDDAADSISGGFRGKEKQM